VRYFAWFCAAATTTTTTTTYVPQHTGQSFSCQGGDANQPWSGNADGYLPGCTSTHARNLNFLVGGGSALECWYAYGKDLRSDRCDADAARLTAAVGHGAEFYCPPKGFHLHGLIRLRNCAKHIGFVNAVAQSGTLPTTTTTTTTTTGEGGGPPSKAVELEKSHPESPSCGSWGQPQTPLLAQG